MDNYGSNNAYENQSGSKYHSSRERSGLIPVTANIINKADIGQDEIVEYQGVCIIDITAVGYVVDLKELENRIKITIYDYTGLLEISFFNRQESLESINLDEFKYEGKREPVQIFGTVKVFHGKKIIQGAKLIRTNSNFVLYHRANVIHSWLYLTGKLKQKNINASPNKIDERNEPTISNIGHGIEKKRMTDEEEAVIMLTNYAQKDHIIKEGKLEELFRKFGPKSKDIINKLIDNNKLIESDGSYEIVI